MNYYVRMTRLFIALLTLKIKIEIGTLFCDEFDFYFCLKCHRKYQVGQFLISPHFHCFILKQGKQCIREQSKYSDFCLR